MNQAEQLKVMMKEHNNVLKPQLARVITVASGKGGVGKSSITVNLALELAKLGKRVVILDADIGLANVEVMLGIRPKYNLADLIFSDKKIEEIITKGPMGIGFISGGSGIYELSKITPDQINMVVRQLYQLDNYADVVLVDTGAGISDLIFQFVSTSSELIVIATPEPTSVTDAYALLKGIDREKENMSDISINLITNRVSSDSEGYELYNRINSVVNRFLSIKVGYLGSVLQDNNQTKALMQQKPVSMVFPNSPATKGITSIARKICEVDASTLKQRGIARLFSKMIRSSMTKKGE